METRRTKQRKFLMAVVFIVVLLAVIFSIWYLGERNKSTQKVAFVEATQTQNAFVA